MKNKYPNNWAIFCFRKIGLSSLYNYFFYSFQFDQEQHAKHKIPIIEGENLLEINQQNIMALPIHWNDSFNFHIKLDILQNQHILMVEFKHANCQQVFLLFMAPIFYSFLNFYLAFSVLLIIKMQFETKKVCSKLFNIFFSVNFCVLFSSSNHFCELFYLQIIAYSLDSLIVKFYS